MFCSVELQRNWASGITFLDFRLPDQLKFFLKTLALQDAVAQNNKIKPM